MSLVKIKCNHYEEIFRIEGWSSEEVERRLCNTVMRLVDSNYPPLYKGWARICVMDRLPNYTAIVESRLFCDDALDHKDIPLLHYLGNTDWPTQSSARIERDADLEE